MVERGNWTRGIVFGSLAEAILEHLGSDADMDERLKLLADSHQYQGVGLVHTGKEGGLAHQKWLAIVVDRLEKYNKAEEELSVAMVYNEIGWAYVREGSKEDAVASWKMAIQGF
jgi:hypothetical protein